MSQLKYFFRFCRIVRMSTMSHSKHFYQALEMEERDQDELCSNLPPKNVISRCFVLYSFHFVSFMQCVQCNIFSQHKKKDPHIGILTR